ncbi:MAG: hypothetical protein LBD58_08725 [Treponema sp.]|nr:hypothetical protein [Treponema sp.]
MFKKIAMPVIHTASRMRNNVPAASLYKLFKKNMAFAKAIVKRTLTTPNIPAILSSLKNMTVIEPAQPPIQNNSKVLK